MSVMQLSKFHAVMFSVIVTICAAEIINKSNESKSALQIDEATVNIITSCYAKRWHTVVITGSISENFVNTLSFHRIPVVLINNNGILTKVRRYGEPTSYKLHVFVIVAATTDELYTSIHRVRSSIWWNHMGYFFILYNSVKGCKNADDVLYRAWLKNIPNAKVMCNTREFGILIRGFNPYMNNTPELWNSGASYAYKKYKNNKFAVFDRLYEKGKNNCENLSFENMNNLYGYPIGQFYENQDDFTHTGRRTNINNDYNTYIHILGTFFNVMNATGIVVTRGTYWDFIEDRKNIPDMLIGIVSMVAGLHTPTSRPFIMTGMVAMTKHSSHMSQLEKILSVVDISSNIGVCIVLLGNLLFFKFFIRLALMPSVLETVRIVCNTGFKNLPRKLPPRIYLITVLLFVVTMQGIYQGNLASLLTTVVPFPNIDTWQDLVHCDHTIYLQLGNEIYFTESEFNGRLRISDQRLDCSKYVLNNSSVACVNYEAVLKDQAEVLKLHLSDMLKPELGVVQFRRSWPLEQQFNIILERLFEADVIVPFDLRANRKTLSDFKLDEEASRNQEYRSITIKDLTFIFIVLGFGLTISSIVFFFEIMINRIFSKIRKKRVGPLA